MENTSTPTEKNRGKAVVVLIMVLTLVLVTLYWAAIQVFQLEGLTLYFMQLGLYLVYFLLACWGLKQEQISLPINARRILEALAWTLVGWLVFLLFIQLLGAARLPEEFQALKDTPAWKIGAKILSTWFFVGMGEELLFRGYFLKAFRRHFTQGTDRRRTVGAVLLVSAFFSLWHLPIRISWFISGELDLIMLLVSLLVLFVLGLAYAYLFIRSDNILLTGLVHGVSDYPLVGINSQMTAIILAVAIGCVEISRLISGRKAKALLQ
ncbi:MAG: CPBP family intramembrane metalloprotease [Anaerolineaceae bacterium]|nr:CPBP family intramembrane metalloprotease [Anaerolineaceae bacterium]MBN2677276.1 CPBP family intramembrane metalloprotease [Anaerolineaceae bacterium]